MISTYVFDVDEFENAYGLCLAKDFYLLHFFDGEEYVGAIKCDGSFVQDHGFVSHVDLHTRYWTLFE